MKPDERADFDALMKSLWGALDPMLGQDKLNGLWDGIGCKLSGVELNRIRDSILADIGNPERGERFVFGPKNRFGVSELWAARDRLRAGGPRAPQAQAAPAQEDPWELARASRVGRHLCANFARYSHAADLPGQLTMEALRSPNYRPHPISCELRKPLYEAGRSWAETMRAMEADAGKAPTDAERDGEWADFVADAEREVDAIRARHQLQPKPVAPPAARPAPAPARPPSVDIAARLDGNFSSARVIREQHDEATMRQSVRSLIGQSFPPGDIAKALQITLADVDRLSRPEAA